MRRPLKLSDITALKPFHWGFEFDDVLNHRGGFDVIIANAPWETFKPDAKEFFTQRSDLVKKKKMDMRTFEKHRTELLRDLEILEAWIVYLSSFPHLSAYFRSANQYANQISVINGKRVGSDVNLYKLFLEQSFNLLSPGGRCGIILQSGIYTDLGTKQLREMLFSQAMLSSLFGLSNEKFIFEKVHHGQKFCILVFEKGKQTDNFEAAFRINPREAVSPDYLDSFLNVRDQHLQISISAIRKLSPDSLSVLEFKTPLDVEIAQKLARSPLLGTHLKHQWNVTFAREIDRSASSSRRFVFSKKRNGLSPLYEGKMIWQFSNTYSEPNYWVDTGLARQFLLGKLSDDGKLMDYQCFRLVFRRQASNTNARTLVSTIIPPAIHDDNLAYVVSVGENGERPINDSEKVYLCAVFNSFVLDYAIRQRVSQNLNFFYLYQLPVPRLSKTDNRFDPIVKRAARLICTTSEFDELARELGLNSHRDGAGDPAERARLRAELDGMIANLYGLTEEEFAHILSTFPLVDQSVKDAALKAFREFAPKPGDQEIAALILKGESNTLEFKSSARWDMKQNKADKLIEGIVVKTVAALLNSKGGTLLLGVDDDKNVLGLAHDYKLFAKRDSRDAYENFLMTLLLNNLGKDSAALISLTFHELEGKDVCKVEVEKSPKPIFVKDANGEHLYIRAGNSTRQLTTKEAIEYVRLHWET